MTDGHRQPQSPVSPAANSSRPPLLVEQLRQRVSDVHDLIQISGPFACTIAELLVRLGEPEATLEARGRVQRTLAENHVRTSPKLTVARLRADSVIALSLEGSASTKRVGGTLDRPANAVLGETENGERIRTAAVLNEPPAELTSRMVIDDELRLPNGPLNNLHDERAKAPPSADRASLVDPGSTIDREQQPGSTAGVPPATITKRGDRTLARPVATVLLVGIVGVIILVGIVGAIRASGGGNGTLNAFTGGGSSGAQTQVVSQAEKTALQQTRLHPTDPAGWAALVQARWTEAGQGNDYNASTGTFTAAGKKELTGATGAWERYLQVTKQPDPNLAILAARAYAAGGNYSGEASAWEIETLANPNEAKGYECLAVAAYAAKQARKGDLATAKALSLVPKLSRATLKTQLEQAKTQPSVAQGC